MVFVIFISELVGVVDYCIFDRNLENDDRRIEIQSCRESKFNPFYGFAVDQNENFFDIGELEDNHDRNAISGPVLSSSYKNQKFSKG